MGLAMVVAAAALPADLRASFRRHVDMFNRDMWNSLKDIEQEEHDSGASVAHGRAALLVSFFSMLGWFSNSHALLVARPGDLMCCCPTHAASLLTSACAARCW